MLTGAPRESGHVQSGPGRSPRPPRPGAAAAARPLPGKAALGEAGRDSRWPAAAGQDEQLRRGEAAGAPRQTEGPR